MTPLGASVSGVGSTQTFQAEARDSSGGLIAYPNVVWASLNPNVATIDANGSATAVSNGQVTITAKVDGVIGYALLTVSVPGLAAVGTLQEDLSESLTLNGIWGASGDDIFAVGRDGVILKSDGVQWSLWRADPRIT